MKTSDFLKLTKEYRKKDFVDENVVKFVIYDEVGKKEYGEYLINDSEMQDIVKNFDFEVFDIRFDVNQVEDYDYDDNFSWCPVGVILTFYSKPVRAEDYFKGHFHHNNLKEVNVYVNNILKQKVDKRNCNINKVSFSEYLEYLFADEKVENDVLNIFLKTK